MNFKDFTVLYVEDETIIRSNVEKCLGYIFNVKVAQNGNEGLEIFNSHKVDLVITDIYMPQKDGIEMMHDIRALNPNIPCIITSAYDPQLAQQSSSCAQCNYLSKPFDIKELLNDCMKALNLL